MQKVVEKYGSTTDEVEALSPQLKTIHKSIAKKFKQGGFEFAQILNDKETIVRVQETANYIKSTFKSLIVIGIGGSDLGARALFTSLGRMHGGVDVHFLGATTDPEEIVGVLAQVDLTKTAINIVSKSGSTIEPMSTFLYVRKKLIEAVGFNKHGRHIIATTGPAGGILKTLMDAEGHKILPIPPQLAGRFSVLSSVGLFPAACAGINIKKLLKGAQNFQKDFLKQQSVQKNGVLMFAALQYLAFRKRKQNITVIVPYTTALKDIGAWFVQLWAESLGKARSKNNRIINTGSTPMSTLGPTCQHSQLQLWNEGPYDKVITFIITKKFRTDVTLPKDLSFVPELTYLSKKNMSTITNAEYESTAQSLTENNRPHGTLELKEISEKSIGALFMFFEWATVCTAQLLDIDAFNQPGVELSKKLIKKNLA